MRDAAARRLGGSAAPKAGLEGFIDYAGLFPPAGLGMAEAVANYASYQGRADHWALGRFVVPVARLGEFESAWEALGEAARLGTRWPLSALVGAEITADLAMVTSFRDRHAHGGPRIVSLEARAEMPTRIEALAGAFGEQYEVFVELPLGAETGPLIEAVLGAGLRAKIRTGGTRAGDFPPPEPVLRFLATAARHLVAFKATAGLHHPVRGPAPLTYEPGSARAVMYGYLNLLGAAATLWRGGTREAATAWLTAEDRETLRLDGEGLRWEGRRIATADLAATREEFFRSVGSCSFTEPLDELQPFLGEAT